MRKLDYSGLTGEVITKEDFTYEEERKAWNRAIEKYPHVIVYCYSENDVCNSVIWAKLNLLEIRIRNGRHHYEGDSTGNDVIVIDVSKMEDIFIDEEKNIVIIQGGVKNRELYDTLGKLGYPFPGGGCPTVGVAGLALGGGWGYSNRLLGLTCDSLVEIKMIDFNGNAIVASSEDNLDLFWACRGAGGGNFGVIVSMTFKLPPKIKMTTLIDIDFLDCTNEEMIKIIELWIEMFENLDRRINLKMSIYNSQVKGRGIRMVGLFYGNKDSVKKVLNPFESIMSKCILNLDYMSVVEANRRIQDSHPPYEKYKSSGRFVYNKYNKNDIENIINLVKSREEGSIYAAVSLYGLGGAIMDVGKKDTAFYYRDAKFIIGIQSVWEDFNYAQRNRGWVKERIKYISTITTGSYINFPFEELNDYEKEYYSENLERLRLIKKKYDPYDIFNFSQGIKGV